MLPGEAAAPFRECTDSRTPAARETISVDRRLPGLPPVVLAAVVHALTAVPLLLVLLVGPTLGLDARMPGDDRSTGGWRIAAVALAVLAVLS